MNNSTHHLSTEDWAWWNSLNHQWKKIFTAHIYYEGDTQYDDMFDLDIDIDDGADDLYQPDDLRQVLQLTTVSITDYPLDSQDLIVLSKLSKLTRLDLSANELSDISLLANFTHLTELYLSGNHIRDISPIAQLTHLTELYLSTNQIQDITPLAGLQDLSVLHLSGNQIQDITPLSHLTDLEELSLNYNAIRHIEPLAQLQNLDILELEGNPITPQEITWLQQQLSNTDIEY